LREEEHRLKASQSSLKPFGSLRERIEQQEQDDEENYKLNDAFTGTIAFIEGFIRGVCEREGGVKFS